MVENLVAIVDDDESVRASTTFFLESSGIRAEAFPSGDAFLAGNPALYNCVLLDLRMAGTDGLTVMQELSNRDACPPVLVITGHGDIPAAVQAMKLGAYDFLEKPYAPQDLLTALEVAFVRGRQERDTRDIRDKATALVGTLSQREREVTKGILRGEQNKIIAFKLGLSVRTIEAYRAGVLKRLGVRSTVDLARVVGLAEWREA